MKLIMENWKKFLKETMDDMKVDLQSLSDEELQYLLTKHRFTPDHPEALAAQEEATRRFKGAFKDATPEGGWAQGMEPAFPPEEDEKLNENMQAVQDLTAQYPNIGDERIQDITSLVHKFANASAKGGLIDEEAAFVAIDQEFYGEEAESAKRLISLNLQFQRERAAMTDDEFARDRDWPPRYEEYN